MRSPSGPVRARPIRAALLFSFAFVVRLVVGLYLGIQAAPEPGSDEFELVAYGQSIARGEGLRGASPDVADQHHLTAYRPPGVPIVYAGVALFTPAPYAGIRLLNIVIGAASCLLLVMLGTQVFSERLGWVAGGVWAIYPRALFYSASLMTESLGLFTLLVLLLLTIEFGKRRTISRAVVAGASFGVALLVHPSRSLFLPFVGIWGFWVFRRDWRSIVRLAFIPVTAGIVLTPWIIRNYRVFHAFIPLSTGGGTTLNQGNNRIVVTDPKYFGYAIWDTEIPEYADSLRAPNDEVGRDRVASRLAMRWIMANKSLWSFLAREKLKRAFTPFLQPHVAPLLRWGELLSWGPLLLGLLLGFVPTLAQLLRREDPGWLHHVLVVHFAVSSVLFFGLSRYRYVIEPSCLLIGLAGLAWCYESVGRRHRSESTMNPG